MMPSTADAPTTKEAIAQAIRRRNALQAPLSGSMNRTVACGDELDIARKLSFSAALLDPIDDPDESNKVQVRANVLCCGVLVRSALRRDAECMCLCACVCVC